MMAPLLSPAAIQPVPRISQLLPTVKCSNCSNPVPLAELGDHVCTTPPPLPKSNTSSNSPKPALALPKPSFSPAAAVALLPTRLQNLVITTRTDDPSPVPSSDRNYKPRTSSRSPSRSPSRRPSPDERVRTPFSNSSGPSNDSFGRHAQSNGSSTRADYSAKVPPARLPMDPRARTPSNNHSPITPHGLSNHVVEGPPRNISLVSPASLGSHRGSPISPHNPPRIAQPIEEVINTASGGEAGMAGVGRRGFAAAARAAMYNPQYQQPDPYDARPAHAQHDAQQYLHDQQGGYGHSPVSSGAQYSSPTSNSSSSRLGTPQPHPRRQSPGHDRHPDPAALYLRTSAPRPDSPASSASIPNSASPVTPVAQTRLPFSDKMRPGDDVLYESNNRHKPKANSNDRNQYPIARAYSPASRARSASSSSSRAARQRPDTPGSSEGGLAYADSTADEDDTSTSISSDRDKSHAILRNINVTRSSNENGLNHVKFPSASSSSASQTSKTSARHEMRNRHGSVNSASVYSDDDEGDVRALVPASKGSQRSGSGRSTTSRSSSNKNSSRREGVSEKMGTLNERGSASSGDPQRSKTLPRPPPEVRNQPLASSPVVHSRTGPSSTASDNTTSAPGRKAGTSSKVKVCIRCDGQIRDGAWVAVDGGGVLCEHCWKNMYLPRCRRCDLPIEKAAVSSSDGQLKGKYHKECFNCHTCHKPFPDKTFYVFDGKPFCAYHYHEANDSLCAAARCGQPIEGPCAVSHAGDRYHPEHFLCEHDGYPPCKERLAEYWEVDGRMLCERHGQSSRNVLDDASDYGDSDDGRDYALSGRAMKRVTRFIDLGDSGLR